MHRAPGLSMYVAACLLGVAALTLSSCGSTASWVGIESISAANERQEAVTAYVDEKALAERKLSDAKVVAMAEVIEVVVPGAKAFVKQTIAGVEEPEPPKKPEPRDDPSENLPPWAQSLAEVGAAVALSYLGVNAARNRARKQRGEALTPEEAKAKGYFEEGKSA